MYYRQDTNYRQRTVAGRRRVGIFRVLFHLVLVILTHGVWLLVLGLYYLLKRL
jgi:hypothetical protein